MKEFAGREGRGAENEGFMNFDRLPFRLEAQAAGSRARAATFQTLHGPVQTPLFMPVGTQATVKAQLPQTLEDGGLADPAREYLSPAAAAGAGGLPARSAGSTGS